MPDDGVLMRPDVWRLSNNTDANPWPDAVLWYARAVGLMQTREFNDPTSWRFQAAIHGYDPELAVWGSADDAPTQDVQSNFWQQCEHGTYFFLPWHRMYLYYFERIVRASVASLGGPANWTLPYWDYNDTGNPSSRVLPPAFRSPTLPNSNTPNPLYVKLRGPGVNEGKDITLDDQNGPGDGLADIDYLKALGKRVFSTSGNGGPTGFGGPSIGLVHQGHTFGALENNPHNQIHLDIGGIAPDSANDGLMTSPDTAALDPIFWIHHANIDRLWTVWKNDGKNDHTDPTSSATWVNQSFQFYDESKNVSRPALICAQVTDTRKPPLNYYYENETNPLSAQPNGGH